ncbi:hypothetical protein CYY_001913 [Polysphondylium violaceum]|uniref:Nucleoside diphosphate kinase n=1 Tax=Polysphondylium violaceum TaxID=133409 RepID=A0A8J4V7F5_9MYCE|nr:hypothetical protein CYY_001913 [Polysphondylium violaceum]
MSITERSFIAVKPDGVARGLVGEIIARFEKKGFVLAVDFITSGPVVAMVWEGKGVVAAARLMIGQTNPLTSAPGTIRGDFAITIGSNIIHGSDSVPSAEREIALWFSNAELQAPVAVPNKHVY